MGIDLVGQFINQREAYSRMRGFKMGSGDPMPRSWSHPFTTWADAFILANHFLKYAAPDGEDCIKLLMKHKGMSRSEAEYTCAWGDRDINPLKFVKTADYNRAKSAFLATIPSAHLGFWEVPSDMEAVYPHNESFWYAAQQLMIERSAAGVVPFWSEIAAESLYEALDELPKTISNALSKVDPRNLIPDLSPLMQALKWGTIAGGLYLLYTYTKPKEGAK
jgi:hypothetical protein